jgi:CBS-domain-containing membrane protein
MSRELVLIPQQMSLASAAHLLSQAHVTGAPVVDTQGRCIGVLSATDFIQLAEKGMQAAKRGQQHAHCVCSAWQIIKPESLPADTVANFMTADPVTVGPGAPLGALAQMMVDAHIHRLIVVDAEERPIGIVSSMDILAALARAVDGQQLVPEPGLGAFARAGSPSSPREPCRQNFS